MRVKQRYLAATTAVLFGSLCLLYSVANRNPAPYVHSTSFNSDLSSSVESQYTDYAAAPASVVTSPPGGDADHDVFDYDKCTMATCFDYSRCKNHVDFKVYVYPVDEAEKMSAIYAQLLEAIRNSRYYTNDSSVACLFVPSLDTLDRDVLSNNYVHNLDHKLTKEKLWRDGRNHLIFNLYAGTWPEYREHELGLTSRGHALLAKASASEEKHRRGYDVSFPLIHASHAIRGGVTTSTSRFDSTQRHYKLVFKGKRYLTGIGSETRNSLYHVHNDRDVVLLTTCKHGNGWQKAADQRCPKDNRDYDKYDYKVLLHNSTFCLVPRGRRLGSFRYLEALQAACIPVLLSNGWVLPFDDVIDWNRAAIWGDERLLLQIPSLVRSIEHEKVLETRQQSEMLWNAYFSSIQKIVDTTLEIIKERIFPLSARSPITWNNFPGALLNLPTPSKSPSLLNPFQVSHQTLPSNDVISIHPQGGVTHVKTPPTASSGFTTILIVKANLDVVNNRVIKSLAQCSSLRMVLILCMRTCNIKSLKSALPNNVNIVVRRIKTLSERYRYYHSIKTRAVLTIDEDALLNTDEIEFGFHVWQNNCARLVGYEARSHHWNDLDDQWSFVTRSTNEYSMVSTSAAFYHNYYNYLYMHYLSNTTLGFLSENAVCDSVAFNMLVSHASRSPPVKVADRTRVTAEVVHLKSLYSECLRYLVEEQFGYQPLLRSWTRADPLLFRDTVSIARKRYRQLEHIT